MTGANGYQLVLGDASYDAAEFEDRLAVARASSGAAAIAAYDHALELWSGRAFGDDASEWWLSPVATRLEELRLVAHEERCERLIEVGRHAEAVADLQGLIADQPLREQFIALEMRALYLSGRQAEALRTYRSFADYLAEETGLDPSDMLVDLEHRILIGDPSLAPSSAVAVPGYELGDLIGEGAFGAVYRAVQPSLGREVAVKAIRAELADDPRFVQRFETEAQLVARLEHPHVVPLYDFWRQPGAAFLVFRLLRGGSLADRIGHGPLGLAEVSRMVGEIGGALAAAHALGIVHRDVKPANVLFDETGNSYLADFGIADGGSRSGRRCVAFGRIAVVCEPGAGPRRRGRAGIGSVLARGRRVGGARRGGAVRRVDCDRGGARQAHPVAAAAQRGAPTPTPRWMRCCRRRQHRSRSTGTATSASSSTPGPPPCAGTDTDPNHRKPADRTGRDTRGGHVGEPVARVGQPLQGVAGVP